MNWLDKIIENKRQEVAAWRLETPVEKLMVQSGELEDCPDFRETLTSKPIGLIAECKRRSPSAGVIRDPFEPAEIARAYEAGGAQALSVLIDQPFFGGGPGDFKAVREAVSLPLLYKEFVIDEWQVAHAASIGASAVLLIVAALSEEELVSLAEKIKELGMQALVEVHDEAEAEIAIRSNAEIIGINNRNLKTFETTLETTRRVMQGIPDDRMIISESGINKPEDVTALLGMGVHAILVGEHLLRKKDLVQAVKDLMGPALRDGK